MMMNVMMMRNKEKSVKSMQNATPTLKATIEYVSKKNYTRTNYLDVPTGYIYFHILLYHHILHI